MLRCRHIEHIYIYILRNKEVPFHLHFFHKRTKLKNVGYTCEVNFQTNRVTVRTRKRKSARKNETYHGNSIQLIREQSANKEPGRQKQNTQTLILHLFFLSFLFVVVVVVDVLIHIHSVVHIV